VLLLLLPPLQYDKLHQMAFETFKRQRAPISTEPSVTIQKRGTLSLNMPAYSALGEPKAVELLYDREAHLMALRQTEPGMDSAYVVRPLGKGNSTWLISGKAFTSYYGIETGVARRWAGRVEEGLLIFDLSVPGVDVSGNRNRQLAGEPQALERPLFAS
jgi:hypothetical protein